MAQMSMELRILEISLSHRVTNVQIREKKIVVDIGTRVATLKWRWAGHVVRFFDAEEEEEARMIAKFFPSF